MIVLKDKEVKHDGLVPEMYYALGVAAGIKAEMFGLKTTISALLDGQHNPGSLHPLGKAADLRTRDITAPEAVAWFEAVKQELEPMGFDCVFEGGVGATPVTTGAHFHVEFDPKEGETFWHVGS